MFTVSLFKIARKWKQLKSPSPDGWMNRMWYIYIMEYHLAINRNDIEEHAIA